jgi:hypothetical protein
MKSLISSCLAVVLALVLALAGSAPSTNTGATTIPATTG